MIEFDPGDRDEEKVEPDLPVNNHASGCDHRGQTVGESDGLGGPATADRVHALSSGFCNVCLYFDWAGSVSVVSAHIRLKNVQTIMLRRRN